MLPEHVLISSSGLVIMNTSWQPASRKKTATSYLNSIFIPFQQLFHLLWFDSITATVPGNWFTLATKKDQHNTLLRLLHTWHLLHLSCALLSMCHMTEQCREQQAVGYIFGWRWWQSEGWAHSWSYTTLFLPKVPQLLHTIKINCHHFGPVFVSDKYRILRNRSDSPSSASNAAVAVGVEAKQWGHAVNTAQQHGQQPSLHRHLQSHKTTFTHVWSNLPKVETGCSKIILVWGAPFNGVTDPAGL